MNKNTRITVFILLVVAVALVLITSNENSKYRIVKFSGAQSYSNWTFSSYYNNVTENAAGIAALPLFEDELILISYEDPQFYYKYQLKDGVDLNFNLEEYKLFLNNNLIAVEISDNGEVMDWLESVKASDVKDLRSIIITDSLTDEYIEPLNRLARLKPNLGISLESSFPSLEYILNTYNPVWLSCPFESGSGRISIQELIENEKNLELLLTDGEFLDSVDLSGLSQLNQLIIMEFENEMGENQIDLPQNLENLVLSGSAINNLDIISDLKKLKNLSVTMSELLEIKSEINNLKNLRRLSFSGIEEIPDFDLIGEIPGLRRFAFPIDISQENFNWFLSINDQLEIIEMTACESITDIEPLTKLPELRCLSVTDSDIPFEAYSNLKDLKYLSLSYDIDDDKVEIDGLQSKLADTLIVPSSGLCLGSGWLLAFLPILLMTWGYLFFRKKKLTGN